MASSSNQSSSSMRIPRGVAPYVPRRGHVFQGARRTGPRDSTPFVFNEAGDNVSVFKHLLIVSLLMTFSIDSQGR